jgi:hypothetical protein
MVSMSEPCSQQAEKETPAGADHPISSGNGSRNQRLPKIRLAVAGFVFNQKKREVRSEKRE